MSTLHKWSSYNSFLSFSQETSTSSSPLSTPSSSAAPSRSPSSTSGLSSGFLPSPSPSQSSRAFQNMLGQSWTCSISLLLYFILIYRHVLLRRYFNSMSDLNLRDKNPSRVGKLNTVYMSVLWLWFLGSKTSVLLSFNWRKLLESQSLMSL